MKRTLITTSLVLGSVFAGSVAFAATDGSGDQNVSANVAATLEMTAPSDLDLGALDIGQNESSAQTILVKSNVSYGVQIKGDRSNMTEFDGSSFSAGALSEAFEWKEASGSYADISVSNASIVSSASPTPHAGTSTSVQYRQEALFDDEPVSGGNVYRVVLTFTATQGI
jgi:hypothetical protein